MKAWYEELYEDFEKYHAEPYVQNTRAEVDFVEQELGHDRTRRILDVGCGNGRHTLELARRGYPVVGVDLSESMLEQGRQQAEAEGLEVALIRWDARELEFEAEFDAAIMLCEGAFSLMETDEMDRQILANIFRGLRPGGKLIMTCPNAVYMLTQQTETQIDLLTFREAFKLDKQLPNGGHKQLDCSQRYYTCPELRGMLLQADFQQVDFFACTEAGYDREVIPTRDHFEFGAMAVKQGA